MNKASQSVLDVFRRTLESLEFESFRCHAITWMDCENGDPQTAKSSTAIIRMEPGNHRVDLKIAGYVSKYALLRGFREYGQERGLSVHTSVEGLENELGIPLDRLALLIDVTDQEDESIPPRLQTGKGVYVHADEVRTLVEFCWANKNSLWWIEEDVASLAKLLKVDLDSLPTHGT